GEEARIFVLTLGAGVTPGRCDGSAVLSRWQWPRTGSSSRSREKMRCADFHVFSMRVQGPQPLPPTAQVIPPSCLRQRSAALTLGAGVTPAHPCFARGLRLRVRV